MSTNYYFQNKDNFQPVVRYHIGKISSGWTPIFQANNGCLITYISDDPINQYDRIETPTYLCYSSIEEIHAIYDSGEYIIVDEYDDEYSWEEFKYNVLEWEKRQRENGINDIASHLGADPYCFQDSQGYEFTTADFS